MISTRKNGRVLMNVKVGNVENMVENNPEIQYKSGKEEEILCF